MTTLKGRCPDCFVILVTKEDQALGKHKCCDCAVCDDGKCWEHEAKDERTS